MPRAVLLEVRRTRFERKDENFQPIPKSWKSSGEAGDSANTDWAKGGNQEQQLTQIGFPMPQAFREAEESETFGMAGAPPPTCTTPLRKKIVNKHAFIHNTNEY